jgi:hypothetical protein
MEAYALLFRESFKDLAVLFWRRILGRASGRRLATYRAKWDSHNVWEARRLLPFPENGRFHLIELPIEEIVRSGPCMDFGPANPAVELAGVLV